ncbi:hypothetical protein LTR80_012229 [Exophiala xenobiotica]|nr:hypothetical protein LTR14_012350 [Exophiala xenobiotica]
MPLSASFGFARYEIHRPTLTAETFEQQQIEELDCNPDPRHPRDNVTEEITGIAAAHAEGDDERTIDDEDKNRNSESSESHMDQWATVAPSFSEIQTIGSPNPSLRGGERDPEHASDLARQD